MNGAHALVRTLADCGVTACFANPGTSEMHLVSALDGESRIRSVLCLFEGVATGAADGFARMAGFPAMTLLHLGPGLLNGGANLHNARRAFSPSIQVVGDHASGHAQFDAPLASDIAAVAGSLAQWVGRAENAAQCGPMAALAFQKSLDLPGGASVLILPADAAWSESGAPCPPLEIAPRTVVTEAAIMAAAQALRAAAKPVLLIGGAALTQAGLASAARLETWGVRVMTDTFPARQARGAGVFAPARMQYFSEMAQADLAGADLMVLLGARAPVAFFAYPDKPASPIPPGCQTLALGGVEVDGVRALEALAAAMQAPVAGAAAPAASFAPPSGPLSVQDVAISLARHMPEGAIIADDGVTSSLPAFALTAGAAPHDWLCLTGGAIGMGMPLAIGAAIAEPARKVICLSGDGAGMYTPQALWTMAREGLDITVIVFANRSYRILNIELARTGAGSTGAGSPGLVAGRMLSLDGPALDWVQLAQAQGLPARRCERAEDFDAALAAFLACPGPKLIEAMV